MNDTPGPPAHDLEILRELAVLYELSLSIGTSADFETNCSFFLQKLMARKSLDLASIWLRSQHVPWLSPDNDQADFVLAYISSANHRGESGISSRSVLAQRAMEESYFSTHSNDSDFAEYVSEEGIKEGAYAVYRLQDIGFVKLFSGTKAERFSTIELAKLENVIEAFSRSLKSNINDVILHQHIAEREELDRNLINKQKLESLGVMAGGIAHDFNNLLMVIMGNADLIKLDQEGTSEEVNNIVDAAKTASMLCSQLLAFSGRGTVVSSGVQVDEIVDEIVRLAAVNIPKSVHVNMRIHNKLPAVTADASQMRQVILNLVANATDAIAEERGHIDISTGIYVGSEAEPLLQQGQFDEREKYVFIEVEDSGSGMTLEVCERIFDPFFSTKFSGSGLGLSALAGVVASHRGIIQVWSVPDIGTKFRVYFPTSKNAGKRISPKSSKNFELTVGVALVIDDDRRVRSVLSRLLKSLGFDVLTAADGGQGIATYSEHSAEIDVVVLDLTMPVLSGEQVYELIMGHEPNARIILASGYSESDMRGKVSRKNNTAFLEKPFDADTLKVALNRVGLGVEA